MISEIKIKLASMRGQPVISGDWKRCTFMMFRLIKNETQATKTTTARNSNTFINMW